jgi:hypothetical protein
MLSGMNIRRRTWGAHAAGWLAVCSGLLLVACAAPAQVEGPAVPVTGNQSLQSVVEVVLADAAKETGMDRDALEVLSAEAVTWPDGSLGCPEPGVMYTQALVPGYRIRIRAGERTLNYHANRRGYFVLCPGNTVTPPADGEAER